MKIKLVLGFVASLLDEAAVLVVLLWALPRLGISMPLPLLIVLLLALAVFAVVSYWLALKAITRQPVIGLSHMAGSRGLAVTRLDPRGTVKIKGELWQAVATSGPIAPGDAVVVVGRDGLTLTVRKPDGGGASP